MEIVRRIFDLDGNMVRKDTLDDRFTVRQDAEDYIKNQVSSVFAHHGYNDESGYWWGRQDGEDRVVRFTVVE